jgi:hypothetical protein
VRRVDVNVAARIHAPAAAVASVLVDLSTYPAWLSIVESAQRTGAHEDDDGPAWDVGLVGRLGPLARRTRVRMVRCSDEGDGGARFERRELDGRSHAAWVLTATATTSRPDESDVRVALHYGGAPPVPGIDLLLRLEAARAGGRLERYVLERGT